MESFNWNQLEAFNGAVPGDFIHNINKMGINVNNLSYIIPTSTPYLGDTTNKHLKDFLFYMLEVTQIIHLTSICM